jgi:peptide/nickel transport system substrate-binding protein
VNRFFERKNRMIPLLLSAVLFLTTITALSGCDVEETTPEPSVSEALVPTETPAPIDSTDDLFTINYDSGSTLNPITGTDADNMAVSRLMYESLFTLNEHFLAEKVLCSNYLTEDGINYNITIKQGIAMSDGSTLDSADVKYSLNWAKESEKYSGRLNIIDSISTPDSNTVVIKLKAKNFMLTKLLDIPIIKYGSIDYNVPAGSGPYVFSDSGSPHLSAFTQYRDAAKIPISVIYLEDCSEILLSEIFADGSLDFIWDDPSDASELNIISDHEVRYYNTSILQYVGFNANSTALDDARVRRAISLAVDRNYIVNNIFSRHAVAAPLILSPEYSLYDKKWEPEIKDPMLEISSILALVGMEDNDSNGYLEYPGSNDATIPFTLDFIVNSDNPYKVSAAQSITDTLKTVGFDVNLKALPWEEYTEALDEGSFDMYYADVLLPADFDLTALLTPGGSLDFGNMGSDEYALRIAEFLASVGEQEITTASQLCSYIAQNAPIIPVLYKQHAVHSNRNVITGMKPTQADIFYGLTGWKIDLG